MSTTGQLLLETELGLVVRDARDYSLQAIHPSVRGAKFLEVYGPDRVLLQVGDQYAWQWSRNTIVALKGANRQQCDSDVITNSPWIWRTRHLARGGKTVTVVHARDSRARQTVTTSGRGVKFRDDIVQWIARDSTGSTTWLATADGLWGVVPGMLRRQNGQELLGGKDIRRVRSPRTGAWWWQDGSGRWRAFQPPGVAANGQPGKVPAVELSVSNPALTIDYVDGKVHFKPFDGPAAKAFREGRLFHDTATQMCASGGQLYFLIPDRCLLSRDRRNPSEIVSCLPLPRGLPPGIQLRLRPVQGTVQLELRDDSAKDADHKVVWVLQPNKPDIWRRQQVANIEIKAQLGPVQWVVPPKQADLNVQVTPQRLLGQDTQAPSVQPLRNWWSNGRFAWEDFSAVVAVRPDQVVLVTPLGLSLMQRDQDQRFQFKGIWLIPRIRLCRKANSDTRRIGALVERWESFRSLSRPFTAPGVRRKQYLISPGPDNGLPQVTLQRSAGFKNWQAVVWVQRKQRYRSIPFPHIGLSQIWTPDESAPLESERIGGGAHQALRSELKMLPDPKLLRDGQFAFDRAGPSCELTGKKGQWLTVIRDKAGGDDSAILCRNRLMSSPTEAMSGPDVRLVFEGAAGRFAGLERVRHDADGTLWAGFEDREGAARLVGTRWEGTDTPWLCWERLSTRRDLRVTATGLQVGSKLIRKSNDAWEIGRRDLRQIMDFHLDREQHVLWTLTRGSCVFKVLLDGD